MDSILVTGGTSFAGTYLVQSLVEDGYPVRVLARSASKAKRLLPSEVEVLVGDITDEDARRASVDGIDVVYQLVAAFREPGLPDRRYHEVNVDAAMGMLEAAHAVGVKRFVHCSTVGVLSHIEDPPADETYPYNPDDIYQRTKAEAERRVIAFQQEHDFPLTVARPSPIYGPGDYRLLKLFRLVAHRRFVMLGDGQVYFHLVHARDLAQGFRLCAEHPNAVGEVFILAGEHYYKLEDVVNFVADAVGVPHPTLKFPARPVQIAGSLCEAVCIPLGIEPPLFRRRVDFFTKSRAFSIQKAKQLLGFQPEIPLEDGIHETADWARAEGLIPDHPNRKRRPSGKSPSPSSQV